MLTLLQSAAIGGPPGLYSSRDSRHAEHPSKNLSAACFITTYSCALHLYTMCAVTSCTPFDCIFVVIKSAITPYIMINFLSLSNCLPYISGCVDHMTGLGLELCDHTLSDNWWGLICHVCEREWSRHATYRYFYTRWCLHIYTQGLNTHQSTMLNYNTLFC